MDTEISAPDQGDANELRAQFRWLQKQVFTILVLLIIVSGTVNVLIWREFRTVRIELNMTRQQAVPLMAEYDQVNGPRMDEILRRFKEYARMHPDYLPVLAKYGITNLAPTAPAATQKK